MSLFGTLGFVFVGLAGALIIDRKGLPPGLSICFEGFAPFCRFACHSKFWFALEPEEDMGAVRFAAPLDATEAMLFLDILLATRFINDALV